MSSDDPERERVRPARHHELTRISRGHHRRRVRDEPDADDVCGYYLVELLDELEEIEFRWAIEEDE